MNKMAEPEEKDLEKKKLSDDSKNLVSHKSKLEIKSLNFWYGEKQILYDINIVLSDNEITALIGPSGCGKSTLLRCINRMNDIVPLSIFSGQIMYEGKNIYDSSVDVVNLRKKIGMVFQKPNPFPMSIFDNVAYGLRIQNLSDKDKIKKKVEQSLRKADLWEEVKDRLDISAFRLSGGQQQRMCIARALAIDPDVILMDEPCSALDPIATAKIEALLKKLKNETTIVIVTHNMQQAKRVSDKTCYLLNGRIVEFSETHELFENPQSDLTKGYIHGDFG